MKVELGPYRTWVGPFQIADWLQHIGVSEDRCYKIGKWLADTWLNDLCTWIHSKKERKIKIRIDPYDTWSVDSTLAMIAVPLLKQLKATNHGTPMIDWEDSTFSKEEWEKIMDYVANGYRSDLTKDEGEWATQAHEAVWAHIQDEMIWALEKCYDDSWEEKYFTRVPVRPDDNLSQTLGVDYSLDVDMPGLRKEQERIAAGLRLFGKYFQALWD